MAVRFFNHDTRYRVRGRRKLRDWFDLVIREEGAKAGAINIILCQDDYLAELNFKYLKHKTLTDIITFPYEHPDGMLDGDIFISLPRVKENAKKYGTTTENELHRVMIHGILHLTGQGDKTDTEKGIMTRKEDMYLTFLEC